MLFSMTLVAGGLTVLGFSGDRLVDFAVALARRVRLSPAVIALTIVAMGTSLPELAVSVTASAEHASGIAVGNAIGSNIANLALVMGVMAVIAPVELKLAAFRLEYPVMLLSIPLLYVLARDRKIDRIESSFLLFSLLIFLVYSVWLARRQVSRTEGAELKESVNEEAERYGDRPVWFIGLGLFVSLLGLLVGSELLVKGASDLAVSAGISERLIGLTVVAIGTSLPELVASVAASRRKQHEMAIMNIVGSNIFNSLGILGAAGCVRPLDVDPGFLTLDLGVYALVALLVGLLSLDRKLSRLDGSVLLGGYFIYLAFISLDRLF